MTHIHPQFDPVALSLGPISVHWYGLMYLLAFIAAFSLAYVRSQHRKGWTADMVSDLVFYGALGVILGGRIGYVIFYEFDDFIANPLYLFKVWQGGMSFHGGFLGVMAGMWFFAHKYNKTPFQTLDFIAPCVPTGLLFGRLGNFINGELWGRISDGGYSWLMAFPQAVGSDMQLLQGQPQLNTLATNFATKEFSPSFINTNNTIAYFAKNFDTVMLLPRHPSQLYEALGEGLLLFILLWWFSSKPRPRMAVSALFLLGYGVARFTVEFFRQPDIDQGFIWFGWMTKGQILTAPMIVAGIIMMVYAYKKGKYDW